MYRMPRKILCKREIGEFMTNTNENAHMRLNAMEHHHIPKMSRYNLFIRFKVLHVCLLNFTMHYVRMTFKNAHMCIPTLYVNIHVNWMIASVNFIKENFNCVNFINITI